MDDQLRQAALQYHRFPKPGKISIAPTKGLSNQRDLSLAYSPGVSAACLAIQEDPAQVRNLTCRGNLVGVVTNGTAVLGLLSNGLLRTVAILAVIAAGFGWLTGRVNTGALVTVIIGIALIFSAPWIVDQLNGG